MTRVSFQSVHTSVSYETTQRMEPLTAKSCSGSFDLHMTDNTCRVRVIHHDDSVGSSRLAIGRARRTIFGSRVQQTFRWRLGISVGLPTSRGRRAGSTSSGFVSVAEAVL